MPETLCEECGLRPARVTVTRTFGSEEVKSQLCATCARDQGGWLFSLMSNGGLVAGFPDDNELESDELAGDELVDDEPESEELVDDDLDEHIAGAPLAALMDACFAGDEMDADWHEGAFADEEEIAFLAPLVEGGLNEAGEANLFQTLKAVGGEANATCPGCGATWAQIGHDERAGCSRCYATFRASLALLLEHVQRAPHHQGKSPRAARKRVLRLEHLRQRRDHQLQMLQNRLAEAVRAERYEEAAALRDKIKLLFSSAQWGW